MFRSLTTKRLRPRQSKDHSPLESYPPREAQTYFAHLVGEYHALPDQSVGQHYQEEFGRLCDRSPDEITWDDIIAFELLLLRVQPIETLRRKAWLYRARYREAAGVEMFDRYRQSHPPCFDENPPAEDPSASAEVQPAEDELLRADLEVLLHDLFWLYRLQADLEAKRNGFFNRCFWIYAGMSLAGVAGFVAALLLPAPFDRVSHPIFTLYAVALTGATGGLISMLLRLGDLSTGRNRVATAIEMIYARYGLLLQSLLTGAGFAITLLLISTAGLVRGDLFPDFSAHKGTGFGALLGSAFGDGIQFAKLLAWSFIAGFAERLVPDIVDRLATAAEQPAGGQAPQVQSARGQG